MNYSFLFGCLLLASPCSAGTFNVDSCLSYCHSKVRTALNHLVEADGWDFTAHPRNILSEADQLRQTGHVSKHWAVRRNVPEEWCAGFWPGILWYDYAVTKDTVVLRAAKGWTEALHDFAYQPVYDHDLGFEMIGSYLNAWRFTGDETYRQVLLAAADTLATLFNPRVGTLLSWPRHVGDYGGHNTIMDNMLNLELLFFSGTERNRQIAVSHADTTMAYHFRQDGTVNHVAVYDPVSGQHLYNCTHQGFGDNTLWSRGQAWAIYGYTMVYGFTKDRKYLNFAQKVTDVYLQQLTPDGIPYWDLGDPVIPFSFKDASAAAAIASALIDLSRYVGGEKGKSYHRAALHMLTTLSSDEYLSKGENDAFLLHSVGNYPAGSEIDASIVYADYYYIEALYKLKIR